MEFLLTKSLMPSTTQSPKSLHIFRKYFTNRWIFFTHRLTSAHNFDIICSHSLIIYSPFQYHLHSTHHHLSSAHHFDIICLLSLIICSPSQIICSPFQYHLLTLTHHLLNITYHLLTITHHLFTITYLLLNISYHLLTISISSASSTLGFFLDSTLTRANSISAKKTNNMQADIHMSIALMYDTRGTDCLEPKKSH